MNHQYFNVIIENVIIEKDADGYLVASVPAFKGCHTQAKSYDQLMIRIQEAIALCLEMEAIKDYASDISPLIGMI